MTMNTLKEYRFSNGDMLVLESGVVHYIGYKPTMMFKVTYLEYSYRRAWRDEYGIRHSSQISYTAVNEEDFQTEEEALRAYQERLTADMPGARSSFTEERMSFMPHPFAKRAA